MKLSKNRPSKAAQKKKTMIADVTGSIEKKRRLNTEIEESVYKKIKMQAAEEGRTISEITRKLWLEYLGKNSAEKQGFEVFQKIRDELLKRKEDDSRDRVESYIREMRESVGTSIYLEKYKGLAKFLKSHNAYTPVFEPHFLVLASYLP